MIGALGAFSEKSVVLSAMKEYKVCQESVF